MKCKDALVGGAVFEAIFSRVCMVELEATAPFLRTGPGGAIVSSYCELTFVPGHDLKLSIAAARVYMQASQNDVV